MKNNKNNQILYFNLFVTLLFLMGVLMFTNFIINNVILIIIMIIIIISMFVVLYKLFGIVLENNNNINTIQQKEEIKEQPKVKSVKYTDEDIILEAISEHDENFSKERFLSYSTSIFLDTIKNDSDNDLKKLRMHEDRSMYNKEKEIITHNLTNHTRHIRSMVTIKNNNIASYEIKNDKEYLSVKIRTRLLDYVIDAESNVIEGSDTNFEERNFTLTFVRNYGVITTNNSLALDNCPNCGAVIKANSTGICVYCKTNLINGNVSWVLHEMNEE